MTTLDWIVLGLFFLGLVGIIVWVLKQKEENTSDYFLAGRDATWIAIGASIFASNIGSEHLVGSCRRRCSKWHGHGALGNARMADTAVGLAFCAFLCAQ
jgi:uncharacterized sodium:solute symporter family permease YidK